MANYAQIAQPLTEQLQKDSFGWTSTATIAFEKLKAAMVSSPVIAMPNFSLPFILETEASGYGIGLVLIQGDRPIAYFSKISGTRARLKSVYEKELMAICLAVLKWKHYLQGRHFTIRTDQQSLKFIMQQREVGADYQRWVSNLMGFDFEIVYKPGAATRVAEALSRKSEGEIEFGTMISSSCVNWEVLDKEMESDSCLAQIKKEVLSNSNNRGGLQVVNGRLLYKNRVVIPRNSSFIPQLMREYHDSPVGGHSGDLKIYLHLAADWFWQGMRGCDNVRPRMLHLPAK